MNIHVVMKDTIHVLDLLQVPFILLIYFLSKNNQIILYHKTNCNISLLVVFIYREAFSADVSL